MIAALFVIRMTRAPSRRRWMLARPGLGKLKASSGASGSRRSGPSRRERASGRRV